MIVSREEGERRLRPYLSGLARAIHAGDQGLDDIMGDQKHRVKSRSISSTRNDLIIHEARRIFDGDPTVRFESRHGRDIMYIKDDAIILFKKLDRSRRTRNAPTQLALKLFGQQPLDEMPLETPRFVAGWQMDMLGMAIQVMMITYPKAHGVEWVIPLDDYGAATKAVPITPPPIDGPGPQVRKKAGGDADAQTASSG